MKGLTSGKRLKDQMPEGMEGAAEAVSPAFVKCSQDCFLPAASFLKKRLVRRPGYMRAVPGPQIGLSPPVVGTPLHAQDTVCSEEKRTESRARHCGLFLGSLALASGGQPSPAPSSGKGDFCFKIQSRTDPTLSDRLPRPCRPGHVGRLMDGPGVPGPALEVTSDEGARDIWGQEDNSSSSQGSGLQVSSASPCSHDAFISSFSFIQLSLGSLGVHEKGEICPPSREAKSLVQNPTDMKTKAASLHRTQEDPWLLSRPLHPKVTQDLEDCAWVTGSSPRPGRETPSSLDGDSAPPCSLAFGPIGSEAHILGITPSWDPLLKKYEPALRDCLLNNQKQLKIKSLKLKLQKLQDKAIEDDDYDKAEKLKQRLEGLEQESSLLQFQLPSRLPAVSKVLKRMGAQVQAALCRAAQKASSEDPQPIAITEPKLLEPVAQDRLRVSITRRDRLLQEKQQLQEEIKALQARMSMLEAKDEQLKRELEEQEQLLSWPGCELAALASTLSLDELQKMGRALDDTLASANQVLYRVETPESIRSLREKIKSLSLSLKEITVKMCMRDRLCRTLRKKVSDIEVQLPALLEAKMLAISGSYFCTAKDLTEEIWSLVSERDGLEELLSKLLVLGSRTIRKLENIKEDYNKLRKELKHEETAYDTTLKENTMKYMEMLEEKLHSCQSPLLEKVWEADLEACRLFIQSMQLKEARCALSVEDERLMGNTEGTAFTTSIVIPPRLLSEDGKKAAWQDNDDWKAQWSPSPHVVSSTQEEESYILSEEFGERCEAIGKKLLSLEDQLHTAIHCHNEDLIHILFILQIKYLLGCYFMKDDIKNYTVNPCLCTAWKQIDAAVIHSRAHLRSLRLFSMYYFLSNFQ
ncbi:LOW QUALITY PROTEIN: disrupted in schizophrenia 1 protein [Tenrec ecaudatus]|uniref:LOW QUALITY PROTEIN: disrupted in schizophrenia 1 protein n=1 Tax=Tenrec ecaudatus TaxID=94439 RepID=UPI003F5A995A